MPGKAGTKVRPMESHAMLVLANEDKAIAEEEEEEEEQVEVEEEVVRGGPVSAEGDERVKAFLSEFQAPSREEEHSRLLRDLWYSP